MIASDCLGHAVNSNRSIIYDVLGDKHSKENTKQFEETKELPSLLIVREILHIILYIVLLLGEALSWFCIYKDSEHTAQDYILFFLT